MFISAFIILTLLTLITCLPVPGIYNTAATRNQELLIPLARTRYGLKSIINIGSHIWNNIPLVIRTKATTKLFTKALSIYLITCYNNN